MMISKHTLLFVSLLTAPLPTTGQGPPGGGASATACNNKSEGDQCTFTYGGGPNAGQSFSGACSGGVCGAGTQEENPHFACPVAGGTAYTGTDAYKNSQTSSAAPLRGNVGCVDQGPLATRPKGKAGRTVLDASNIYGAMEAGFTKAQPGAECLAAGNNLPDFELPGGVDTNLAEAIMHQACKDRNAVFSQALLDYCGGHADPFHYHERMNCLYTADPTTSHSTRIGTAADGNGIYGHNIEGGCEPTDLDWCGGRTGVTPDSQGQSVYYYVVSNRAPFALGCFGPVTTEAECRALYPECDGVAQSFTTAHGTDDYDLDCPCFNPVTGGNMPGQGKPNYLGPNGFDAYQLDLMEGDRACNDNAGTSRSCTQDEKDAVSALYSSQKCSSGGASFVATCGEITDGGLAFASCTGSRVYDSTKAATTSPDDANCCKLDAIPDNGGGNTPLPGSDSSDTDGNSPSPSENDNGSDSSDTDDSSGKSNATVPESDSDLSDIDDSGRTTIAVFSLMVFSIVSLHFVL